MKQLLHKNRLLFFSLIIAYLIVLSSYCFVDYLYNKNKLMMSIDKELFDIASTLKYILPADLHDRAADKNAITIKEDKEIANKLTQLTKETAFKYAYTIIKKEGKLFFIASDISEDPETERGTFYFYQYEDADKSFYQAFGQENPTYMTVSDKWGTVRTVMIPETSSRGEKYLACVDYDISYVKGELQKNLIQTTLTALFFFLLGIPILIIYRKLQKEYTDSLEESNSLNLSLLENSPNAIAVFNEDTSVRYVNPSFEKISGYSSKEVLGTKVPYPWWIDELEYGTFEQKHQSGLKEIHLAERRYKKKNGEYFWVELSVTPIFNKGILSYSFSTWIDITDRKKSEKEKRKLEEQLVRSQKMESLGLLAGGVAHDLNNVLAGIVSFPELLLMDLPENSNLRKPLEVIKESGDRATAIVQDLLTIARGVATTKKPLNLNSIVNEYLKSPEFQKLQHYHPGVTVITNLDSSIFNIIASSIHIRKIVMNLVSNASEAIDGTGNINISTMNTYLDRPLKAYDDVKIGEYVVLSVSDDGSGISSADINRIFEPFYSKKVMGRSGTGLGLAVVWNVIKEHDGYINVTSDKSGTVFDLYLPITRAEIVDEDLIIPIEDFKGKGEKILVVDDMANQRDIICRMLEKLGYTVHSVSSGEKALEYLKDHTVDLVLLDMIMDPGINGRETYEGIIKIHPGQKAIIVSGFAETDQAKAAMKSGVGQFIKKPLTLQKIGMAIKKELR